MEEPVSQSKVSNGSTRKNGSAATRQTPWLCAASGLLGGLAGGLFVAVFLWFGGTREGSRPAAREAAATTALSPVAASEARESRFPAGYDTLGVALGPEEAPVVVREFADYQCPYCASFADVTERIREEYVETGKVRFVFFDLPIESIHPNAMQAAQAARCAGLQDVYWDMHDALFANQAEWAGAADPLPDFRDYARRIGIDPAKLARCVESGETSDKVRQNLEFARGLGVRSTPTVVIGDRGFAGSRPWPEVRSLIEQALSGNSGESRAPQPGAGRPETPGTSG